MKYDFTVTSALPETYRTNRVHSLFNVTKDQASTHHIKIDLPLEEKPWKVGAIIGPSGTGKSTLGRALFGLDAFHEGYAWGEKPMRVQDESKATYEPRRPMKIDATKWIPEGQPI